MVKRILIITTVSGFLAKFEKENVRLLQESGYEVHYASNRYNQVYKYDENIFQQMNVKFHHIDIVQSPFRLFQNRIALKQIEEIMKREQITLIHCHTPVGGVLGRLAGRHFAAEGVRVIYTVHGFHFYKGCNSLEYKLYYGLEQFLSRYTDAIVTVNHEDYEVARKFMKRNGGMAYLIPGIGVDMNYFYLPDTDECEAARKELGIGENFFILSVGEIRKNKNHEIILKALGSLKEEGFDISQIQYGIVGEGLEQDNLIHLAKELGVENNLILYGYHEDVRLHLKAADVLAFPSVREGFGMAAVEGLAMGLPVLAADNRGTREYMWPPKNGLLYPAHDVAGFAEGIKEMLSKRRIWKDEKQRKEIREGVLPFDKSCSNEIMRKVYEQAGN